MLEDKWSPDVVVGYARENELFETAIIPCTTTLYHWIDSGVMKTHNLDLLENLSRNTKKNTKKAHRNQRVLGPSIEDCPQEIETRKSFGHWEIDTVIGSQAASDPVLLTLVERKTRYEVILKIKDKTAQAVDEAIESLRQRAVSRSLNYLRRSLQIMGLNLQGFIHLYKRSSMSISLTLMPLGSAVQVRINIK